MPHEHSDLAEHLHRAGWGRDPGWRRTEHPNPEREPWTDAARRAPPLAVLVDRDGTIVAEVPFNRDPALVLPMPGARVALDRLRAAGLPIGVLSDQDDVASGMVSANQAEAVDEQLARRLGPFEAWASCPHRACDRCGCRKPRPGLVRRAARDLGVEPERCVVIGDHADDIAAAHAAGAYCVLVPTARTRPAEILAVPIVAGSLRCATDHVLAAFERD